MECADVIGRAWGPCTMYGYYVHACFCPLRSYIVIFRIHTMMHSAHLLQLMIREGNTV
jgi:hypothetical protein